jgi:hypothetical protein
MLYANAKDGTIPQGTADGEAPEAIRENWCTRRRTDSPRHRRVPAFTQEGIEMKKRAAIYARVSTGDQHLETQLLDLREMAKQRGYEIAHQYTDVISGAKSKRLGLDQLMTDARRHRFDIVLVAAFDRIARNVRHFLDVLDEQHRELRWRQRNRSTRRLRPAEPPALQSFVTQFRMQMLRSQPRALCASRIRSIRSAGGSCLVWVSGTTAME